MGVSSGERVRLVDRDYVVFKEVDRWRVCASRHIFRLSDFSSQSSCDRRLRKLLEWGYLERQRYLYGVPYLYRCTRKSKILIYATPRIDKIKLEQIHHDLTVLDVAIYFHDTYKISFHDMVTEKQLHQSDGFGIRQHRPDFIYNINNQSICVEVELTIKSKSRLEENIKSNFMEYDKQIWVVPDPNHKIPKSLKEFVILYPNIEIIFLSDIK